MGVLKFEIFVQKMDDVKVGDVEEEEVEVYDGDEEYPLEDGEVNYYEEGEEGEEQGDGEEEGEEEEEEEEEEEDECPVLKYQRLATDITHLITNDRASCMHMGPVGQVCE